MGRLSLRNHPETTEKIFRLGYDVAAAAITCASLGLGKTMTICRSIVILGLSLWALFAPALTSAQGIPRCQPGTALQCTSEGGGPPTCQCVAIPAFPVTGTVIGLTGEGLSLEVYNSLQRIRVYKNGLLSFDVPAGKYTIVVKTQPTSPTQACVLTNGSGTSGPTTSTPFTFNCGTGYNVGGTLSGLAPYTESGLGLELTLQPENTAPQVFPIDTSGPFTFPFLIADGQRYQVTIARQPQGQICTVANDTGTIHGADVTNIAVSCPGDTIACDQQSCISELALSNSIVNQLNFTRRPPIELLDVAGYVVLVGGLPPAVAGQARIPPDTNPQAMSPDLPMNIASVSKTLTAIAVLQLLARDGLTIDTPIKDYIYNDWSLGRYVSQMTFKELLSHHSGFGWQGPLPPIGYCVGVQTGDDYDGVKQLVAIGANLLPPNFVLPAGPCYANDNFSLLRELLPALYYKSNDNPISQESDIDDTQCPVGLGVAPCNPRSRASSGLYIDYLNINIFTPLGISPPKQACASAGTSEILTYPVPPVSPGYDWGDHTAICGAGGWSLKASDLFKVINDLATGMTLLTSDQKLLMTSNCLGWDCAVRGDCPDPYVCKNGGEGTTINGQLFVYSTYAGILKCVPVVVYVNSVLPHSIKIMATSSAWLAIHITPPKLMLILERLAALDLKPQMHAVS